MYLQPQPESPASQNAMHLVHILTLPPVPTAPPETLPPMECLHPPAFATEQYTSSVSPTHQSLQEPQDGFLLHILKGANRLGQDRLISEQQPLQGHIILDMRRRVEVATPQETLQNHSRSTECNACYRACAETRSSLSLKTPAQSQEQSHQPKNSESISWAHLCPSSDASCNDGKVDALLNYASFSRVVVPAPSPQQGERSNVYMNQDLSSENEGLRDVLRSDPIAHHFQPTDNDAPSTQQYLLEHETSPHPIKSLNAEVTGIDEKARARKCPYPDCHKILCRRSYLNAHLRFHTKERPYECPVQSCGMRFRWLSNLTRHKRTAHGEHTD